MQEIKLTSPIINDEYTQYIYDAYDIQDEKETETTITYNLDEIKSFDWNIGVIVGNSGSGKTSVLKALGDIKKADFDPCKPLISNFNWLEPEKATHLLTSIGLSSVPTWLRPFRILSNGEQYRAKVAYLIASAKEGETVLIDEYTSVVDRDVAKAMSYSLQKYIRRENKQIVLASCHYDILEWVMPDWVCSLQKGGALEKGDWLRQGRPPIELQVSRVESDTWDFFKKHHYLTSEVNRGFGFLLFTWGSKPVGICVYKPQPPYGYGLSRTVVLPDYQGLGIGSKISEFTCAILKNEGKRVFTKTVNPALGEYRNKNANWIGTQWNGQEKPLRPRKRIKYKNPVSRKSYCHEYVGNPVTGYQDLLLPINELRQRQQLKLF